MAFDNTEPGHLGRESDCVDTEVRADSRLDTGRNSLLPALRRDLGQSNLRGMPAASEMTSCECLSTEKCPKLGMLLGWSEPDGDDEGTSVGPSISEAVSVMSSSSSSFLI